MIFCVNYFTICIIKMGVFRMTDEEKNQEIYEAIRAGEEALKALEDAAKALNSARNMGILDMLGGGFFISAAKHSRIETAQADLDRARHELHRFHRELLDFPIGEELQIEFDGMTRTLDLFFDNIFTDMKVQARIREVQDCVVRTAREIEEVLGKLHQMILY